MQHLRNNPTTGISVRSAETLGLNSRSGAYACANSVFSSFIGLPASPGDTLKKVFKKNAFALGVECAIGAEGWKNR